MNETKQREREREGRRKREEDKREVSFSRIPL